MVCRAAKTPFTSFVLSCVASSPFALASETMVAMKAMKAGARAMTGGELTKKIAETTQLKTKDVKGVFAALQTIACAEVKKTEKFVIPQLTTLVLQLQRRELREVRDPATHDAEAEAQARTEGGQKDDVREGGEGGGDACLEGCEGLPREGSQGLDLSRPRQDSVGLAR